VHVVAARASDPMSRQLGWGASPGLGAGPRASVDQLVSLRGLRAAELMTSLSVNTDAKAKAVSTMLSSTECAQALSPSMSNSGE
jgi:hypothetical protein